MSAGRVCIASNDKSKNRIDDEDKVPGAGERSLSSDRAPARVALVMRPFSHTDIVTMDGTIRLMIIYYSQMC